MSLSDDIDKMLEPVESGEIQAPASRQRNADWQAGLQWNGVDGIVTTDAMDGDLAPDWSGVLRLWGLDPEQFSVVEPILFNAWGNPDGTLNRQWKGKVVRKIAAEREDVDTMVAEIKRVKRRKPPKATGSVWLVVVAADWQAGKRDGDGIEGLASRWYAAIADVEARWKELTRAGYKFEGLLVLAVGDLVEGCGDHYAMQTFSVQLDRRDQVKMARRMLRDALVAWAKFAPAIRVAAVGGNHGENRKNGKSFTTFNDNDDVALVESVAEILGANPEAFGHVEFAVPRDKLTLTVEVAGKIIGITHGHLANGSGSPEGKLRTWLANQALGKQSIADCDVLVTGHYHHLRVTDWGGILWLQAPALDGGSDWWIQVSGQHSSAGVLTFTVAPDGVHNLQVL